MLLVGLQLSDFGRQSKPSIGDPLTLYMLVLQLPPEVSYFLGYSLWGYNVICDGLIMDRNSSHSKRVGVKKPHWLSYPCAATVHVFGLKPINAFAFALDGLYYGVSDFRYAAYSMILLSAYVKQVLVGIVSSVFLLVAAPVFGLAGIWAGLFLFMTLRVAARI
ncbi:hypothetical protein LOK49_LG09G00819 [Camellia lanceoleosa]|uniref:Uncharacterized protein n=1 Tax=Camellia lanceoleosa TaxID=1840588 RepID=A0ACC0GGL1_9ERIC|nr:hypothetical protein LOK49_LG09G00819 [Camellia lanceoleosa]